MSRIGPWSRDQATGLSMSIDMIVATQIPCDNCAQRSVRVTVQHAVARSQTWSSGARLLGAQNKLDAFRDPQSVGSYCVMLNLWIGTVIASHKRCPSVGLFVWLIWTAWLQETAGTLHEERPTRGATLVQSASPGRILTPRLGCQWAKVGKWLELFSAMCELLPKQTLQPSPCPMAGLKRAAKGWLPAPIIRSPTSILSVRLPILSQPTGLFQPLHSSSDGA